MNEYIIKSNSLIPGEFVTRSEINDFAYKNNFSLLCLEDRIRQEKSNTSCGFGSQNGTVYHTFSKVSDNFYQYCGQLYKNADVFYIDNIIPAELMIKAKEAAKKASKRYIINFDKKIRPDSSIIYYINIFTDGFEKYNYDLHTVYTYVCNCHQKKSYIDEIYFLKKLKDINLKGIPEDANFSDYGIALKIFELNIIDKYLEHKILDYEEKKNEFLFNN